MSLVYVCLEGPREPTEADAQAVSKALGGTGEVQAVDPVLGCWDIDLPEKLYLRLEKRGYLEKKVGVWVLNAEMP